VFLTLADEVSPSTATATTTSPRIIVEVEGLGELCRDRFGPDPISASSSATQCTVPRRVSVSVLVRVYRVGGGGCEGVGRRYAVDERGPCEYGIVRVRGFGV
jgi:hypothetical protein